MRGRGAALAAVLLCMALAGLAQAEVVQRGNVRVAFDGNLTPRALPRTGSAPVAVELGGRITTTDGRTPPRLRKSAIAINRFGRISPGSLPSCRVDQIQPATTEGALEACRRSLVGRGSFSARVLLPEQAPFPSSGEVYAFNGTFNGRPAILAHVYGTEPAPTSYTLPFVITKTKGTFGTLLTASLPGVTSEWGYVTALELNLDRTSRGGGYVAASCPAPAGFRSAPFPLARASFGFAGRTVTTTLTRSCAVR